MIRKTFLITILLSLVWSPMQAKDFYYNGSDCTILYRFIPSTGTLNDLTVTYNGDFQFYPSHFGGITTFNLAGKQLHPWEEMHVSELLYEKTSGDGDIYEASFRWSYQGEHFDFTIKMQLSGKTLSIDFSTDPLNENAVKFSIDRSEHTPEPKIICLPYGHNVLLTKGIFVSGIIDHMLSNASAVISLDSYYSFTSAFYGHETHYNTQTDGSRNHLKEKIYITVSPDISETFFHVSNPVSPFRDYLVDKVIVDLWSGRFENYRDGIKTLADMGMTDLFALIHVWQKYGYDNGLPTTFPAGDSFGGENALFEVIDICEANDYLFALHTNYVDFYENSDVWDSLDVALNSNGSWVMGWFNDSTGIQSYLMKPSRVLYYAGLYEPLIHNSYRTTAGFLDVHSSVLPSYKVDFDAKVSNAGKQSATFLSYKNLISYARDIHSGPVAGEGFGSSANIWAGYIDAIEADPRSSYDRGGTDVPLVVDYKLKELHHLFVPHGAGYLERFFLDKWTDYSIEELERYRVTQIAYGNAGFIHNPFEKEIPSDEVLKDYCFLKHLQHYYLSEQPEQILYRMGNELLTLSEALRRISTFLFMFDISKAINEELSMLKITYSEGFTLYVNRSTSKTWDVEKDGIIYELPPNGFLAYKGDEFLAYTAVVDGIKRYYMHPKETICFKVLSPVFSIFSGYRVKNRSLLQAEYIDILTWEAFQEMGNINGYRIYQVEVESGNWDLLAELDSDTFEYRHRNVGNEKQHYALVAVDEQNKESDAVYLSVQ